MDLARAEIFIQRLAECETTQAVGEAFSGLIKPFGYFGASASELRHTPNGRICAFSFNTWPDAWREHYEKQDYVRHDPIPLLALLIPHPFSLSDAFADCEKTEKRRAYQAWIAEIGIADVFAVPMRFPGDDVGMCVSVADHMIENPAERRALHFAAINVLLRCRELIRASADSLPARAPLSAREIECMRWVLEGKSDTDIGQILNISRTTAHFHIERVKKKLGVRTRIQAAKLVVSLGYV